jgi:nucleoside-diphosphate-sugar epimerase
MKNFNTNNFISTYITEREQSLFANDIEKNRSQLHQAIDGKSVMVIGGAGTIGSSYIKAILQFKPAKLYVVDLNENGLTELVRDLRSSVGYNIPEDFKTYPIDFAGDVFEKILVNEGPFHIVANFAAHKHVRSEKDHYSIEAMVENNVIKAKKLLDLLVANPPEHFFCVSTDKAANPVNVMGASKKLMEDVILAYAKKIPITTARFANVAFSNGSLLFGFIERMMKRQPLSSPTDVKRYFVSPAESGEICMLACMLGKSGQIFFPKLLEEQMKTFSDIGISFLKEFGNYEPDYCNTEEAAREKAQTLSDDATAYPVYFFPSDTSGEKEFEEFFVPGEDLDMDTFEQLGVICNAQSKPMEDIEQLFDALHKVFQSNTVTKQAIVDAIGDFIPNFKHIETGKSLDQKM